jgi:ketosteroid isomerase-like protein
MWGRSIAAGILLFAAALSPLRGQQPSDINAIKAAHQAFYAALTARDLAAMERLWANKPYIVLIAPSSKAPVFGTAAVKNYWQTAFAAFSNVRASSDIVQGQTDGKLAWIVATEAVEFRTKAGKPIALKTFVTHIFEKEGERWLLVSHQSQLVASH